MPSQPRKVKQSNRTFCWSAALESWLYSTPGYKRMSQKELRASYGDENGRLTVIPTYGPPWAQDTGFQMKWLFKRFDEQAAKITGLTAGYFRGRLARGHVYLSTPWTDFENPVWHCIVVYGVRYAKDKKPLLAFMNPMSGGYEKRPLEFFRQKSVVFLGWPDKPIKKSP